MTAFAVVKHRRTFIGSPKLDHRVLDLGPSALFAVRLGRGTGLDVTPVDHGDTGSLLTDQRGEILLLRLRLHRRGELGVCEEGEPRSGRPWLPDPPLYMALQHSHSRMLPLLRARGNKNPQSPQKSQDAIRRGSMRTSAMFASDVCVSTVKFQIGWGAKGFLPLLAPWLPSLRRPLIRLVYRYSFLL